MQTRKVKICGVGKYMPKQVVPSVDIDQRLGKPKGWTENYIGVEVRHFVEDETASQMGALAAREALDDAGLTLADVDCIVCASGTMEQIIPCTASLVQKELGLQNSGISCFDINSTCLSFVTALDTVSYLIEAGRYQNILIISSEVASVGINWRDEKSAALFGDGAVAVVIGKTPEGESSKIMAASHQTYSSGAHLSEIYGGGTKLPPNLENLTPKSSDQFLFAMDGVEIFKMARKLLPDFVKGVLEAAGLSQKEIKLFIPHQASKSSMALMKKRLKIGEDQWVDIVANHGNMIAASIPAALYEAIRTYKLQRGDIGFFLGTSAGLSLGGLVFEY